MHKLCLHEHKLVGYENEILTPLFLPHHARFYIALLIEISVQSASHIRTASATTKSNSSENTLTPHWKPMASVEAIMSEPVMELYLMLSGLPSPTPLNRMAWSLFLMVTGLGAMPSGNSLVARTTPVESFSRKNLEIYAL